MRFKTFSEAIKESESTDLYKCYLAVKRSSGQRWWSYKDFAGDKYFKQITENNIDDVKLDPNLPILNYNTEIVEKMLEKGCKVENVYNKPEFIKNSGSKKQFHQLIGEDENLPMTVFTRKDAHKIGFPMIAKPTDGHSGIGIQIFKTQEEFDKADHSKFDLYSQFVDKAYEHRFFCFNGAPIFWMERKPMNEKAKSGGGKADEEMNFQYIKHDHTKIPDNYNDLLVKYTGFMKDLPYICFDVMESKDGKLYIIESNSQPGVPFDSTVEIYKHVFQDFYGRPVNQATANILEKFAAELISNTLESDKKRFKVEL